MKKIGMKSLFVLAFGLLLNLAVAPGCMTRRSTPVYAADSTLVYPSRMAQDVNASISFQLKDSAMRDAEKKRDKERGREIARLKKDKAKLLAAIEKEQEQNRKAEAKKKAAAERKAKKAEKAKKGKKGAREGASSKGSPAAGDANTDVAKTTRTVPAAGDKVTPASGLARMQNPAMRDTLASIESRLAALQAEDSIAALAPWKQKREGGSPVDERVFGIEEGARILATVRLENVYARGKRPLMFHIVWLNPERKRVFKRMIEYVPNDSTQSLNSSLTISPLKRSAGHYSIQVFLFREQIAEKTLDLTGQGVEEGTKGGGDAM
jgi:hypothetical protein